MFFKFLIKTSPSHLSLCQPWPTCRARPTYRHQPLWSNPTSGSVSPTGHTPSLTCVVFSPAPSLATASPRRRRARFRRAPPESAAEMMLIDRSSDSDSACPQDLVDCFLDARIPFTFEAWDLGHGDLELDLELLGPVLGEICAW
jgi:hypothetical protein